MNTDKLPKQEESVVNFSIDDFFRGYLFLDVAIGVLLANESHMFNDEQKRCVEVFWSNAPTKRVPAVKEVLAYFRHLELNEMSKKIDM